MQKKKQIGLRSLAMVLDRADEDNSHVVSDECFEQALNSYGIFMKKIELQALVKRFDTRGDGKSINICDYMSALREPL